MKGYKCKSDYLAIKRWGISAFEERQKKKMGTKSAIQKVDEVPEENKDNVIEAIDSCPTSAIEEEN